MYAIRSYYDAFNLQKPDAERYDIDDFKAFIMKLDLDYLEKTKGVERIAYAKKDIDNWYRSYNFV